MRRVKTFLDVGIWPFTAHRCCQSILKYVGRGSSPLVFSVRSMIFYIDYLNIHRARQKHKNGYMACFFRCCSGKDTLIQIPALS